MEPKAGLMMGNAGWAGSRVFCARVIFILDHGSLDDGP